MIAWAAFSEAIFSARLFDITGTEACGQHSEREERSSAMLVASDS